MFIVRVEPVAHVPNGLLHCLCLLNVASEALLGGDDLGELHLGGVLGVPRLQRRHTLAHPGRDLF